MWKISEKILKKTTRKNPKETFVKKISTKLLEIFLKKPWEPWGVYKVFPTISPGASLEGTPGEIFERLSRKIVAKAPGEKKTPKQFPKELLEECPK